MNKEWSETFKQFQKQISNKNTFSDGIKSLLKLRKNIFDEANMILSTVSYDELSKQPFVNSKGYENKTMCYSIYHIARIEDIVVHELIKNDKQVFINKNYQNLLNTPIITTGNELVGDDIRKFSEQINVPELKKYFTEVYENTNTIISKLEHNDLKRTFTNEQKQRIIDSGCVSTNENAFWLIDYWCNKNVKGLLLMPLSRHWIMHIEAFIRIRNQIIKTKK